MKREIEPGIGDVPEKGIYGISPAMDGDLLEDDYIVPKKGGGITGRKLLLSLEATGGLLVLTGCVSPSTETPAIVTPTTGIPERPTITPTLIPSTETEPTPTKEAVQSITEIVVTGFGMEELTSDQREYLDSLEANFISKIVERVEQGNWNLEEIKEFTINKTAGHKDEELVLGGFLVVIPQEGEETYWTFSEELGDLIQAPKYQGISPDWNPDEVRFEVADAEGKVIAFWNPEASSWEEVILPTPTAPPEPTATPTPEIQRVLYLEDNFAGTNRAVFEGPNPHFEGDVLFFTFAENGGWLGARVGIPMSNFRLETRLNGDGVYGLNFGGFRLGGEINYDLILLEDGHLVLSWLQGEEYKGELFREKVTSASKVEGFHTFGLDYDGERLALLFDGEKVGEISEDLPESGRVGLFCWDGGKENVKVGIDSLAIHLPQELIPTPTPPTPEPTETPRPPLCEIPHWPNRTPDRKIGYTIKFGKHDQEIYHPDTSPYAPYDNGAYWKRLHIPGYDKIWVREAQIVSIDKESQTIKFYVGRDQYVQRRFIEGAHVVMAAHEWYVGIPMTEAYQLGGNFCDLEEGDLVAILHYDFGEAVSLNPNLIDLWGVLIVQ